MPPNDQHGRELRSVRVLEGTSSTPPPRVPPGPPQAPERGCPSNKEMTDGQRCQAAAFQQGSSVDLTNTSFIDRTMPSSRLGTSSGGLCRPRRAVRFGDIGTTPRYFVALGTFEPSHLAQRRREGVPGSPRDALPSKRSPSHFAWGPLLGSQRRKGVEKGSGGGGEERRGEGWKKVCLHPSLLIQFENCVTEGWSWFQFLFAKAALGREGGGEERQVWNCFENLPPPSLSGPGRPTSRAWEKGPLSTSEGFVLYATLARFTSGGRGGVRQGRAVWPVWEEP